MNRSQGLPPETPCADPRKGLRPNAVGFWDGLVIGLDSTAPAYSLAAVLGSLVVVAGTKAPAVLLLAFVPIFLIANAFAYLNRADQDCGTTFSWVTRAMGPTMGWLGGWAVLVTGVLVVGSLADVSAFYLLDLVGLDSLAASRAAVVSLAVAIIVVVTWVCVRGTELTAKVQRVLLGVQVAALLAFVVAATVRLARGDVGTGALSPSLSWFSPVGLEPAALVPGLLLGVFAYWGWESAVNLTEESSDKVTAPGRAGVAATVVLLVLYLGVTVPIVAVAGLDLLGDYDDDAGLFGAVAELVLGPFAGVLVLSIIASGIASTHTTLLPASRTALSMATAGAFPSVFARVSPRFATPAAGTWLIGLASILWYVTASLVSDNFLFDSLSALSLMIAFYYALTGLACVVYWRRRLLHSGKAFLVVGVGPSLGSAVLLYLLYRSALQLGDPQASYSGTAVLGMGVPLAIALVLLVVGVVAMLVQRIGPGRTFFTRRGGEAVSDEVTLATLGPPAQASVARC